VELWPNGDEEKREDFATLFISNDVDGTEELTHYDVALGERDKPVTTARILVFRSQELGTLTLVEEALRTLRCAQTAN
jgi:hypothetical protein